MLSFYRRRAAAAFEGHVTAHRRPAAPRLQSSEPIGQSAAESVRRSRESNIMVGASEQESRLLERNLCPWRWTAMDHVCIQTKLWLNVFRTLCNEIGTLT